MSPQLTCSQGFFTQLHKLRALRRSFLHFHDAILLSKIKKVQDSDSAAKHFYSCKFSVQRDAGCRESSYVG